MKTYNRQLLEDLKDILYVTRDAWYVLGAIALVYFIAWLVF